MTSLYIKEKGYDVSQSHFNSFESVAALYHNTKPIKERVHGRHTSRDIRPIFDRSNKDHKVRKLDDNTYVLLDGGLGDPMSFLGTHSQKYDPADSYTTETRNEMKYYAPICWEYDSERGVERLTVRNHSTGYNWGRDYSSQATWRKTTLGICLPDPMIVPPIKNGLLHVRYCQAPDTQKVMLPKGRAWPQWFQNDVPYLSENPLPTKDNCSIVFERPYGGPYGGHAFEWIAGGENEYVTRKRTNLEAKKLFKDDTDAYWEYLVTYAPFVSDDWKTCRGYQSKLGAYLTDNTHTHHDPLELVRDDVGDSRARARCVVTDRENPYRLHLLYTFMDKRPLLHTVKTLSYEATKEEVRKVRSQYVSFMNEWLGLTYEVEELVVEGKDPIEEED